MRKRGTLTRLTPGQGKVDHCSLNIERAACRGLYRCRPRRENRDPHLPTLRRDRHRHSNLGRDQLQQDRLWRQLVGWPSHRRL